MNFLRFLFVCAWKGHDWHFDLNPYARWARAERCDRCGIYYR
jgi:hypothetical protein